MSEFNTEFKVDPKLESIKTNATEFITHERQSITDFGEKVLRDVEVLINDSVQSASSRLNSMFKKVETVIKTEPLVAFTALAITGLALVNLMRKRSGSAKGIKASSESKASPQEEAHFH